MPKLFTFSQDSTTRANLLTQFLNLFGLDEDETGVLGLLVDETTMKLATLNRDILETANDAIRNAIASDEQAIKTLDRYQSRQRTLLRTRIKENDAKLVANSDIIYRSQAMITYNGHIKEVITYYLQQPILGIAHFAKLLDASYCASVWHTHLFKGQENLKGFIAMFATWAREKITSYCFGYVAREMASDANLDNLNPTTLSRIAREMAYEMLEHCNPTKVDFGPHKNHAGSIKGAYLRSVAYQTLPWMQLGWQPNLWASHVRQNLPLLTTRDVLRAIEACSSIAKEWYNLVLVGYPLLYRQVVEGLRGINEQNTELVESQKPTVDKLNANILSELKQGYTPTVPINTYWRKDHFCNSNLYITDGRAMILASYVNKSEMLAKLYPQDKNSKAPYSSVKFFRHQFYTDDIANASYRVVKCLGSRLTTTTIDGKCIPMHYFSDGQNVYYYQTGFIQLLARVGILADVAEYSVVSEGVLVLRNHKREVLAIVQGMNIARIEKADRLDFYNAAQKVA